MRSNEGYGVVRDVPFSSGVGYCVGAVLSQENFRKLGVQPLMDSGAFCVLI